MYSLPVQNRGEKREPARPVEDRNPGARDLRSLTIFDNILWIFDGSGAENVGTNSTEEELLEECSCPFIYEAIRALTISRMPMRNSVDSR